MGMEAAIDALTTTVSKEFHQQKFTNWMVKGELAGLYKNAGNLSYLRVLNSVSLLPFYKVD